MIMFHVNLQGCMSTPHILNHPDFKRPLKSSSNLTNVGMLESDDDKAYLTYPKPNFLTLLGNT